MLRSLSTLSRRCSAYSADRRSHLPSASAATTTAAARFVPGTWSSQQRSLASAIQSDNIVRYPRGDFPLPTGNQTLPEFLFSAPGRRDYVAIEDGLTKQQLGLDQLQEASARFGAGLVELLGVGKGDVVTILCPNQPDYAVGFLGVMMAGAIVSTANTIYTSHELHKQLLTAGTQYILTTAELFSTVVEKAIQGTAIRGVILVDARGERPLSSSLTGIKVVPFSLLLQSSAGALPPVEVDSEKDVAVIPFSSGTTGLPKGVMLSHRNLIANVAQMSAHQELLDLRNDQDSVLCVMPFYHIYGMIILLANGLLQRCRLVTVPKFDPDSFGDVIAREKITKLFVAPPLVLFLLNDTRGQAADLSSVNYAFSAAAPMSHGVQDELSKRLGGNPVVQGYGLTETSPLTHVSPSNTYKLGSIGLPLPNTEAKIRSLDGESRSLPAHENGEVCVRGPQVFLGYLNRPEATAEMLDSDGWLHTGDIGYYDDDGHFYVVDRLKELIKVKGYQVAPAELEAELLLHPDITDGAVIGVPHERFGEAPRAFVVKREGSGLTEEAVAAYISERAAPYKHLVGGVKFMDAVPKSPSGKILRRLLRKP